MLLSNSLCSGRVIVEAKGRMIKKNFKISILIRKLLSCFVSWQLKDFPLYHRIVMSMSPVSGWSPTVFSDRVSARFPASVASGSFWHLAASGFGNMSIFWCATLSNKVAGQLIPRKGFQAATDLMLWSATCFQLLSIWIIRWITSICHIATKYDQKYSFSRETHLAWRVPQIVDRRFLDQINNQTLSSDKLQILWRQSLWFSPSWHTALSQQPWSVRRAAGGRGHVVSAVYNASSV